MDGIYWQLPKPYLAVLKIQLIFIGPVDNLQILKSTLGTGHTYRKNERKLQIWILIQGRRHRMHCGLQKWPFQVQILDSFLGLICLCPASGRPRNHSVHSSSPPCALWFVRFVFFPHQIPLWLHWHLSAFAYLGENSQLQTDFSF